MTVSLSNTRNIR